MAILSFPKQKIDADLFMYDSSPSARAKFRHWHVEILLNKAADLLDRCLAEEAKYDGLRAQAKVLEDSLAAEIDRLEIEEQKAKQGSYSDEPISVAQDELVALEKMSVFYCNEKMELDAGAGMTSGALQRQINAAINNHLIRATRWEADKVKAAKEIGRLKNKVENAYLGSTGAQLKIIELARKRYEARKNNVGAGEALDYQGQAVRCENRMTRDYKDAVDRLHVASKGLVEIYDYAAPFQEMVDEIKNRTRAPIDGVVEWTREAIRWLSAFSQNDQSFTATISLRKTLGDEWLSGYTEGAPIPFVIDGALFASHSSVRVRGISAVTELSSPSSLMLTCSLSVPRSAVYFFNNADNNGFSKKVSQEDVPPCTLGRVESFAMPHEPEICGAISLLNVSPIGANSERGSWVLTIKPINGNKLSDIHDLYVNVLVSAQSKH